MFQMSRRQICFGKVDDSTPFFGFWQGVLPPSRFPELNKLLVQFVGCGSVLNDFCFHAILKDPFTFQRDDLTFLRAYGNHLLQHFERCKQLQFVVNINMDLRLCSIATKNCGICSLLKVVYSSSRLFPSDFKDLVGVRLELG